MSDGIKISVEPEVNFDPGIFSKFESAVNRASARAVQSINKITVAQTLLANQIANTGAVAVRAYAAMQAAQGGMTDKTLQNINKTVAALNQQVQAINQVAQATQQLGNSASGGASVVGNSPTGANRTNNLLAGSQLNSAFRQGTSNVLGIGREVSRGMGLDFDISSSMQRNLSVNKEATQLAIQGESPDVKGTADQIEKESRKLALSSGLNVEDIIKGLRAFHKYTGDLGTGMKQLRNMTESSVAYDTDIKEIASLYAVITKYMGKTGTPEGVDALVRTIAKQGREGAVEIADQIKQDPKILVGSQNFGVSDTVLKAFGGDKRAAQAGVALGLQQSIMGVSGESANQAGNAVKSFMETLTQKNAQEGFKKHGVDVFTKDENGKKVFKSLEELIPIAVGISQKDPTFAREFMPNVRGRKVPQAFSPEASAAYDESLKKLPGNEKEAEKAAMAVALNQMRDAALKFQTTLERSSDVTNYLESEAGKTAVLQANIRESMDQATKSIITSVGKNLPAIEEGMKVFGDIIVSAAEHPKTAIIAAFAAPALQQVVANGLTSALNPVFMAMGGFGIALIGLTAAMAILMEFAPKKTDPADLETTGAGGASGVPLEQQETNGGLSPGEQFYDGGAGGAAGAPSQYYTDREKKIKAQQAEFERTYGNIPLSGGTSSEPEAANRDIDYEKMREAVSAAMRASPIKVMWDMQAPDDRSSGVDVE